MNRLCLLFVLFGLLLGQSASATTHVIISDGHSVYIGSDGLSSLEYGKLPPVCKLLTREHIVFLDWGHPVAYYPSDVDASKSVPILDFRKRATEILRETLTPDATYKALAKAAIEQMQKVFDMGRSSRVHVPWTGKDLEALNLGGLMIWIENGKPQFRDLRVTPTDRAKGLFIAQSVDLPKMEINKPYSFPKKDYARGFQDIPELRHNPSFAQKHPFMLIEKCIDQIAKQPGESTKVGKPYALARLTDKGVVWNAGKNLCVPTVAKR